MREEEFNARLEKLIDSPKRASRTQQGGTHYLDMPIQPWEAMRAWMSREQFIGFLRGNVIKYVARYDAKGGIDDLRKAEHYLDRLIEELEGTQPEDKANGA